MDLRVSKKFFGFIFFYFLYITNIAFASDSGSGRYNFWHQDDKDSGQKTQDEFAKKIIQTTVVSSVVNVGQRLVPTSSSENDSDLFSERERIYYDSE